MRENEKLNMQILDGNEPLKLLRKLNLMDDFLHYVENSDNAYVPEDCDERLMYLHDIIKRIKAAEEIGYREKLYLEYQI